MHPPCTDGNMAEGSMRCDVNISVRPRGQAELGTKVEIKNMNSFNAMQRAIEFEIARQARPHASLLQNPCFAQSAHAFTGLLHGMQVELLATGAAAHIVQETRLWDEGQQCTYSMRRKEGLADYRYFPEPDLPPLMLTQAYVDEVRVCVYSHSTPPHPTPCPSVGWVWVWVPRGNRASMFCPAPKSPAALPCLAQASMPELPRQVRERYLALGLNQYDVLVLSDERDMASYFDAVLAAGALPKPAANWVMGDVMAHCKEARLGWAALAQRMAPAVLAEMIGLIEDGTISGKIGKDVLPALLAGEGGCGAGSVRKLVEARGLVQISDPAALAAIVDDVLAANPKQLQQYREGAACAGAFHC